MKIKRNSKFLKTKKSNNKSYNKNSYKSNKKIRKITKKRGGGRGRGFNSRGTKSLGNETNSGVPLAKRPFENLQPIVESVETKPDKVAAELQSIIDPRESVASSETGSLIISQQSDMDEEKDMARDGSAKINHNEEVEEVVIRNCNTGACNP
jgi:hypothetical protein